jgi:excisionase family DNA binding protein
MLNLQTRDGGLLPDCLEERFAAIERTQREIHKLLIRQLNEPAPDTMTMKEAAFYARYSVDHFRRLAVEQRLIPFVRPSKCQKGKILFRKDDVDAFLNQTKAAGPASKSGPGRPRKRKTGLWR